MAFRHGDMRFGKLTMHDADLIMIDMDPRNPFDFFLDHYQDQLVAGYTKSTPNMVCASTLAITTSCEIAPPQANPGEAITCRSAAATTLRLRSGHALGSARAAKIHRSSTQFSLLIVQSTV